MICVSEFEAPRFLGYALPMSFLGSNVARLAELHGGQNQLAELVGVSQPTISRWIDGKPPRKLEALKKAADLANMSVEDFLSSPMIEGRPKISPASGAQHLLLPVTLPSEERLAAMMSALLKGVGLEDQAAEHAGTLARRLPDALARAAADLATPASEKATTRDERSPPLAKPDPAPLR